MLAIGSMAMLGAAAVAMFAVLPHGASVGSGTTMAPWRKQWALGADGVSTQRKGAERIQLTAYREHGGKVEPITAGSIVSPGDRVRFEIGTPTEREVMIVGVEESGRLFAYYPIDARGRSVHHAGGQMLLEGAAEFDRSQGRESVVLIACQQPFELDTLQVMLPPSCQVEGFGIYKASK